MRPPTALPAAQIARLPLQSQLLRPVPPRALWRGLFRGLLRGLLLAGLLGALGAAPLAAGPWPREKGTGFLSLSVEAWQSAIPDLPHYYTSTFAEYGLTERLTLGSKYAMGSDAGTSMDLRLGISLVRNRPYALSLELTVGERDSDRFLLRPELATHPEATAAFGSVGLAWGRGLQWGAHAGWMSAEITVTAPLGEDAPTLGLDGESWSFDTTLGLTLHNGAKLMAQVFALRADDGEEVIKLAPGVAIPMGQSWHIEIGARLLADDPEGSALALGLWQEF